MKKSPLCPDIDDHRTVLGTLKTQICQENEEKSVPRRMGRSAAKKNSANIWHKEPHKTLLRPFSNLCNKQKISSNFKRLFPMEVNESIEEDFSNYMKNFLQDMTSKWDFFL